MGLIKKYEMVCDKCGARELNDYGEIWEKPYATYKNGWLGMGEYFQLCPKCAAIFNEEKERHENCLKEIFGKRYLDWSKENGERQYEHLNV